MSFCKILPSLMHGQKWYYGGRSVDFIVIPSIHTMRTYQIFWTLKEMEKKRCEIVLRSVESSTWRRQGRESERRGRGWSRHSSLLPWYRVALFHSWESFLRALRWLNNYNFNVCRFVGLWRIFSKVDSYSNIAGCSLLAVEVVARRSVFVRVSLTNNSLLPHSASAQDFFLCPSKWDHKLSTD